MSDNLNFDGKRKIIDGNLITIGPDYIKIEHDYLGENNRSSIISKIGIVKSIPMLYENRIVVVYLNGIVQYNTNLEVLCTYDEIINGDIGDETLDGSYFIFSTNNGEYSYKYDILNNSLDKPKSLIKK